jgi:LmbE family N-acetylglucosaminyl deacetylase
LLAGCGDNQHGAGVPLAPTHDLVVVAHQDDDLLFMQPDLIEAVRRGTGLTNVYITAGNGTRGATAANPRYTGLMEAYGTAAGDQDWFCGWISIAGHAAQHCRLDAENVSLVFLAYPDGGIAGDYAHSLLKLWQGDITNATTVADRTAVYDRDGLIATVAAIIEATHPAVLHTLDLTSGHGYDHSDHMIAGAIAALALARTSVDLELLAYRGYNMASEPANKVPAVFDEARNILGYYEACATGCAACGESCTTIDKTHLDLLGHRYALGFRREAHGKLRTTGGCLAGNALVACDAAPEWILSGGHLAGAGGCLAVDSAGGLGMAACAPDPAQRWLFDDEGHLWAGVAPPTAPNLAHAHLLCITPLDDGSVTTTTCDNTTGTAPRWQWAPSLALTARATLGFAETGRSVRIGDVTGDGLGDLCAVTATGLACAPGNGDGTFGAAVRVDDPAAPLAIDPQSLTLGDLDGDGIADACGRDGGGVLCARSSAGFAAARFTPQFGDGDAGSTTPASLRIADANGDGTAEVCGLAAEGVVCSPAGTSFAPQIRSAWPDPTDGVVPADLDGDHHADWCALAADGPACGLTSESDVTTDGVPWGFAFGGVVETPPHDAALTDIADIDGDGDGDLCAPVGDGTIACARSNGHGFGPRTVVAVLPNGAQAVAMWLGDLDGDGRADVCADLGDSIACGTL